MGPKVSSILAILLLLPLLASTAAAQCNVFDVTNSKYGGKADSDISQALATVWTEACGTASPSTILIPRGTYQLQEAIFKGPCNAPIEIQFQGTLQAPTKRSDTDFWIKFSDIDKLTVSGGGTFDGQGASCWDKDSCEPTNVDIQFYTVSNSIIKDIVAIDSQKFHFGVTQCYNIEFQGLTITAPEDSPNTDGIHISKSKRIIVSRSTIATGDDCVSIGDGAQQILVTDVTCGPGHGISIGSLVKYKAEEPVIGVTVKNCIIKGTTNGARIKTWPDRDTGISTVSDILYEDITMENVKNPIFIDQNYCDGDCNKKKPSVVKISNVRFRNIKGSSASPVAIQLICSESYPCENVELTDIDLTYNGDTGITSQCSNVKPLITSVPQALACANTEGTPIGDSPPDHSDPPPSSDSPPDHNSESPDHKNSPKSPSHSDSPDLPESPPSPLSITYGYPYSRPLGPQGLDDYPFYYPQISSAADSRSHFSYVLVLPLLISVMWLLRVGL